MRVCIFSTAYLPFIGGAEIAIKEITKRLPDWEFDLFTARMDQDLLKEETLGNVRVHRIGIGNSFDKKLLALAGASYAAKYYKNNKPDLVWSVMASYGGFAALRYKKMFPDVPYLLTLQEGDSEEHILKRVGFMLRWRFKQIFKKADGLQAISNYLLEWGKRMGFVGRKEIVIPNGVDIKHFEGSIGEDASQKDLRKFNIEHNGPVILTVSRLVKKNGVDILIDAMKDILEDYHLVIAGEGELEDELKKHTQSSGLQGRVHFLGSVDQEKLPDLYACAEIFCRPSRSEGLGIVFLEAMAAGVPIVAPDVGGIPDIIKDGETGLLCNVEDPKDVAKKINKFINDKELKITCVNGGRAFVRKEFDWDVIAEKMCMFMKKLVS